MNIVYLVWKEICESNQYSINLTTFGTTKQKNEFIERLKLKPGFIEVIKDYDRQSIVDLLFPEYKEE